ncbi:MAG: LEA type 2 family protein [Zoogloeaceae bacterium]|nr:LEA type 2 family protein [Rhodocyclaceae bacterium]MCP5237951.1 LEA type 2 family protein [Zoogloeaceae bacterium]
MLRPVACLAGVAVALAACGTLPIGLEPPEVSLADVRYAGGTLFEQRFRLDLRVINPNRRDLEIEGVSFTVELNGRRFARGVSDQAFVVAAHGEHVVTVHATTTLGQMLDQIGSPDDTRGLAYRVEGQVALGGFGSLPFASEGRVGIERRGSPVERGRF